MVSDIGANIFGGGNIFGGYSRSAMYFKNKTCDRQNQAAWNYECVEIVHCEFDQYKIVDKGGSKLIMQTGVVFEPSEFIKCCPNYRALDANNECQEVNPCGEMQYLYDPKLNELNEIGSAFFPGTYSKCCFDGSVHQEEYPSECFDMCSENQFEISDASSEDKPKSIGRILDKDKYSSCCKEGTVHLVGEDSKCFIECENIQYSLDGEDKELTATIGYYLDPSKYSECCKKNEMIRITDGKFPKKSSCIQTHSQSCYWNGRILLK